MFNKAVLILVLILLAGCSIAVSTVSKSAEHAVDVYAEIESRPDTAAEIYRNSMNANDQMGHNRSSSGMLGALLVFVTITVIVSALTFMKYGEGFLKQFRLARKKPSASRSKSGSGLRISRIPEYQGQPFPGQTQLSDGRSSSHAQPSQWTEG